MDKKLMRLLLVLALSLPAFGQQILAPILQAPAASGGGGGIARVGTGANPGAGAFSGGATAITASFNVGTGNLLYCVAGFDGNAAGCGGATITLSDTGSANTFTQLGTNVDRGYACFARFYAKNTVAVSGDVVTASFGSSKNNQAVVCEQFSGLSTTAPTDQSLQGTFDSPPSTITSTSFTTNVSTPDEVIFMSGFDFYIGAFTAGSIGGSPATLGANGLGSGNGSIFIEYRIVSAQQVGATASVVKSGTVYDAWGVDTFK